MLGRLKQFVAVCPLVLLLVLASRAGAAAYNVIDLGTLGGSTSHATAINDSGEVVGYASLPGDMTNHAFLYSGGKMIDLGTLGGSGSGATAINASGEVVGNSGTTGDEATHAFLYSGGVMTDLVPDGGYCEAGGINASGQIVGTAAITPDSPDDPFIYSHGILTTIGSTAGLGLAINDSGQIVGLGSFNAAFLYSGGTITDLPNLTGPSGDSTPNAINDSGEVAGSSYPATSNGQHAALFENGTVTDLGILGGNGGSRAYGINNFGQIVGLSSVSGGTQTHGFLYSDGLMTDLNSLIPAHSGWTLTEAYGINDNAQIVGYGTNPAGETHAFLLTPVPEPANAGLVILGLYLLRFRPR